MATLFTKIINGDLPGRFVWEDPQVVAFLTIEPLKPGHTLVVPRAEIDHWLDTPPDLMQQLFAVSRAIGEAQRAEFNPARVGLLVEGYGVSHTHLHVWPSDSTADFDPSSVNRDVSADQLDKAAVRLRRRLRAQGHGEFVPTSE